MTKFLTAKQLGITPKTRSAMIWLLKQMEKGRVEHHTAPEWHEEFLTLQTMPFNMSTWGDRTRKDKLTPAKYCGTVHCIGGWIEFKNRRKMPAADDDKLVDLFCPINVGLRSWANITVKQAQRTIKHYLTTGEINWKKR